MAGIFDVLMSRFQNQSGADQSPKPPPNIQNDYWAPDRDQVLADPSRWGMPQPAMAGGTVGGMAPGMPPPMTGSVGGGASGGGVPAMGGVGMAGGQMSPMVQMLLSRLFQRMPSQGGPQDPKMGFGGLMPSFMVGGKPPINSFGPGGSSGV